MARDRISEIEALRSRGLQHLSNGVYAFEKLCEWWNTEGGQIGNASDQLITKIVTIIEVSTRSFVAELIDRGEGYAEKIPVLMKQNDVKLDFAIAQALLKKRVTLGQIVSHDLSLSKVENVYAAFKCFIDDDIISINDNIVEQRKGALLNIEMNKVSDATSLRRTIARLFEVRNIIVHELPDERPYVESEIAGFIIYAREFVDVILQVALTLVYSRHFEGSSLQEAKEADAKYIEEQEAKMDSIILSIDRNGESKALQDAQEAWKNYRTKQSRYVSESSRTPNIALIKEVYHDMEFLRLTLLRIQELTEG